MGTRTRDKKIKLPQGPNNQSTSFERLEIAGQPRTAGLPTPWVAGEHFARSRRRDEKRGTSERKQRGTRERISDKKDEDIVGGGALVNNRTRLDYGRRRRAHRPL